MQNKESAIVQYFGKDTVERFVKAFFERYGKSEETRNTLMMIAVQDQEKFLDLICDYLDKESV